MKKFLLSIAVLTFIGMMSVNGQSTLIISEDFQDWEATEDTDPDKCSAGVVIEASLTRYLTLTVSSGTIEIPVTLIKCGIAPECESRRIEDGGATENLPGVTTGWVLLNKLDGYTIADYLESPDTIGEFIFGPVPHIDSIKFAHSATGGNRGIRIYKSSDGETWERATEDEFWDGDDSQLGDVNTVEINATDVYIKFTSGFKMSDETSQYSRLHNIDVWGIPGDVSYVNYTETDMLNVYPVPAKDIVVVELTEDVVNSELQIIDVLGKTVLSRVVDGQTLTLDISSLNSGMYFIQIIRNDEKHVKQLLVK
ncbi:MAG: T9SS type A sorting domain-containing protein [Bacteroidales bacterium]|nr:T9SS type A sorting domain-containing protein [Bacteroidales bacterium]MBN2763607.1 T9SS type A sorting domain-containing protein [Bacteroidales bacterium]